jgi:Ca-activated chloride channel family protein
MSFLYPYAFLLLGFLPLFFRKETKIDINPKIIVNKESNKLKKIFLAIGYIFLVIALARPVTDKKEISTNMNLKKVALALDISRSMLAEDVYPNRLEFAKHKINQFIDKFNGEIAILGFSNSSFLISPYTTDKDTLKYLLNNINENYITSSGTDLQNLINTAKKMGYKDLVVFTDGGSVKNLDTKGINLYALLVGTKQGAPIKLNNGRLLMHNGKVVIVKRDDRFLKYTKFGVVAKTGDSDINELISQNFQKVKSNKKLVVYKELFIYPLWLGLLFISFGFFSILNLKRMIPIFVLFMGVHSNASILDWHYLNQAKEAYQKGNYQKSAELYKKIDNDEAKYNEADSLYKMKKYKEALDIYNQIKDKKLAEKVEYNKGNCYAKMGKIDEAINSYKNVLKLNPNDKDAKYNLELLEKKKQHKQNKNNQNNNKQKQNSNKNQKQQNKQNNSKNKSQKNQENKNNSEKQNNKNQKQNKSNKQKKQKNELNQKQQKEKEQQNKLESQKRVNKEELQNIKPIKIGINKNGNQNIFNKIKSQTLLYPLSKGKSDENNEW